MVNECLSFNTRVIASTLADGNKKSQVFRLFKKNIVRPCLEEGHMYREALPKYSCLQACNELKTLEGPRNVSRICIFVSYAN